MTNRELKKQLAEMAIKTANVEETLEMLYDQNKLTPANHKNPLTNKVFHGKNVWALELVYILNDYTSCEWSTFAQYRTNKNSVKKGEKGTYLTLAVYGKSKKNDKKEDEQKEVLQFYKGYTVFNIEQTQNGAKTEEPAEEKEEILAEKPKTTREPVVICRMHTTDLSTGVTTHDYDLVADSNNQILKVPAETKQTTLNLWDSVAVVA